MEKSTEIAEIAKALCKFQNDRPKIELNSTVKVRTKSGGEYSFKYATLGHVLEKIQPYLFECHLSYSQIIENDNSITTILMHDSGQYIMGNKPLNLPAEYTAQEVGSFITYYKRYSLLSILGVVAEDDEDGNIASGNTAEKKEDNKKWLNKFDKQKNELPEYWKIINAAKDKGLGISELRKHYKISKDVENELKNDL